MGRFAIRGLVAIFTAIVVLLIQPAFWSPSIPSIVAIAAIGLACVSYFRPHNGLLVLAALAPLGSTMSSLFVEGVRLRGAEVLVLSFLVGVLLRGWALHQFRGVPTNRLQTVAILFGLIVASSCATQLWRPAAEPQVLLNYAVRHYLTSFRGFGTIFNAMLLLEGLALLLYTVHYCRTRPDFGRRLARMLVIGAVAAAAINICFFVTELVETGEPGARIGDFLLRERWSAHVGDVNAAGSFFAMAMLIAFGFSLEDRRGRAAWLGAGIVLGAALWMTASRTAFSAVALVGTLFAMRTVFLRWKKNRWQLVVLTAIVSTLLVAFASSFTRASTAGKAVDIRWMFLHTTWRMVEARPLFGVGVGQYARWSSHYSSAELLAIYPSENAHNNFAQVAGELGLVGLASFLAVLGISLMPVPRPLADNAVIAPVLLGIAAFIVSWLGGHPLLVPEVAYPFWIALAIVPGATSDIISHTS